MVTTVHARCCSSSDPTWEEEDAFRITLASAGVNENLEFTCEYFQNRFIGCWESGESILHAEKVGVSYLSGCCQTLMEAQEEGLILSHLLGGVPVLGIHSSGCKQTLVENLVDLWKTFCEKYPQAVLLQYFYGDGERALRSALSQTEYGEQIILVGVNTKEIPHHTCYYYKTFLNCKSPGQTLPHDPHSCSIGLSRFSDFTCISALQRPYLDFISLPPIEENQPIAVPRSILVVLDYPKPILGDSAILQPDEANFHKAHHLVHAYTVAIRERERWPAERIQGISSFVIAMLRATDLHFAIRRLEDHHESATTQRACMILLLAYWFLYTLGQAIISFSEDGIFHGKTKLSILAYLSTGRVVNYIDLSAQIYFLQKNINTDLHISLSLYGVVNLVKDTIHIGSRFPSITQHLQVCTREQKRILVDRSFLKTIRAIRFYYQFSLALVSASLFSITFLTHSKTNNVTTTIHDATHSVLFGSVALTALGSFMVFKRHD